jgi:uncharacterized membrane protein YcaP (DUF421 family)
MKKKHRILKTITLNTVIMGNWLTSAAGLTMNLDTVPLWAVAVVVVYFGFSSFALKYIKINKF